MDSLNISYQALKRQLKAIYADHANSYAIETHLNEVLANLDQNSRQKVLDRLIQEFEHGTTAIPPSPITATPTTEKMAIDGHVLAQVIKLLLGRDISQADINSDALLESLAESIKMASEALNQLTHTINAILGGKQDSHQIIGNHLEGADHGRTLDNYIGQIGNAFYESQQASKRATHAKVKEIISKLSPENIAQDAAASRLNPMKKSKYYDEYVDRFKKIENWFESGHFMESFLREFQRNCQKISV